MKNLIKISLLSAAILVAACGPNRHFAVNEQRNAPAPETTPETAEQKLGTVQQQGFEFVYVFRRKDGAPLDAEDRRALRENAPPQTNQWIVTDDGATAIAGSNYRFPPENLDALRKRFSVEDKSKPEATKPTEAANADQ